MGVLFGVSELAGCGVGKGLLPEDESERFVVYCV